MKIKNKRVKSQNKTLIIAFILTAIIGAYLAFAWFNHLPPLPAKKESFQPGEYIVNMERTETEKKVSEDLEKNPETKLENKQTDTPSAPVVEDGKQQVNVLLTNAGIFNGQVSAGGMVTNSVEDGGTCTFVFKNGTQEISKTTETMTNSTSTSCKTVAFPASELSDGSWKVFIKYDSNTSIGTSNEKEFTK